MARFGGEISRGDTQGELPPKRRVKWTVFWEGVDAGQGQMEAVSERGHRNPWVVPDYGA